MSLELTEAALLASQKTSIRPQLVLQIEGVDTLYGAVAIEKYIRIGDPGLEIGNDWVIGGLNLVDDQETVISTSGSGASISQQLQPDKGSISSISSIQLDLIDFKNVITELISPGVVVDDILGRNAKLFFGFQGTAFPEDFVQIFGGFIDDVDSGPGNVKINLVHPDQKKRQKIFLKKETSLIDAISDADTDMHVVDIMSVGTAFFPSLYALDPGNGTIDYLRIDDEIIKWETTLPDVPGDYDSPSPGVLGTLTRGCLGTVAAAHDAGAKVESFHYIEGNVIDLALQFMLSGWNGPFVSDVPYGSIGQFPDPEPWPIGSDSSYRIYMPQGVDVKKLYGVILGDIISFDGATADPAINVGEYAIAGFEDFEGDANRIIVMEGSFLKEGPGTGTLSFRSQYDVLGDGLRMVPLEVDIEEHLYWQSLILADYSLRIYMKDTIEGKEFLDNEIYKPYGLYSLPRNGKASVGFHIGPIPSEDFKILSKDNIIEPSKSLRLKRRISRHFFNAVIYKFDESPIEDKFLSVRVYADEDSRNRIPVGASVFTIDSKGIRTDLDAAEKTNQSALRRLTRYKYAAEHLDGVQVMFSVGFNLEPGDVAILDPADLRMSNTADGTREKPAKFWEIVNKKLDLKTGNCSLDLVDTNFSADERYGLISPSSIISNTGSSNFAIIQDSFGAKFPGQEYRKWIAYAGLPVLIHDENWTHQEEVIFEGLDPSNSYKMLFRTALGTPVQPGWIIDIPYYPDDADPRTNRLYKLFHGHAGPSVAIDSGASGTEFTVAAGEGAKFQVGFPVRVHDENWTYESDEVKVESVAGDVITLDTDIGFTPAAGDVASFLGFADGEKCYRII